MSENYYYLVAGLPEILLDEPTGHLSFPDVVDEIMENVSDDDSQLFRFLRYRHDNTNLLGIVQEIDSPFDPWGNYSEEELHYEYKTLDTIPEYMQQFIAACNTSRPFNNNICREDQLSWLYYDEAANIDNRFLREWLEFDLNLKNLLTTINCKKFNIPLECRHEVRFEQKDSQNIICKNEVAEQILKSRAPDFSLTAILPWVEEVLSFDASNLVDFEESLDRFRPQNGR